MHPLSNPLFLSWLAFFCYAVAIAMHTMARAGLTVKSDTPLNSLREYLGRYWPKLIPQWVLGVALFMLFWNNEALGGLLQFPQVASRPIHKLAMALIVGWFSDSVLDKVLALVHLEGKVAPPPEGPNP